jgi:hypothetical protein
MSEIYPILMRFSALKEKDKVYSMGKLGAVFIAASLVILFAAFAVGPWSPHESVESIYLMVERVLLVIGVLFLVLGAYCWWKSGYPLQERL